MIRDTFQDHKAVGDILRSGGVTVKRLGGYWLALPHVQLGQSLQIHSSPTRRRLVLRLLFHLVVITNLSVC